MKLADGTYQLPQEWADHTNAVLTAIQQRTSPSTMKLADGAYQPPQEWADHTKLLIAYGVVNYSATSNRASCFNHYCVGYDVA